MAKGPWIVKRWDEADIAPIAIGAVLWIDEKAQPPVVYQGDEPVFAACEWIVPLHSLRCLDGDAQETHIFLTGPAGKPHGYLSGIKLKPSGDQEAVGIWGAEEQDPPKE